MSNHKGDKKKMSVFDDQAAFMAVTGQQASPSLYFDLVKEETGELAVAWIRYREHPSPETLAEVMDGIMDSIYVLSGMANCIVGPEMAVLMWNEVQASNMSKVEAIETEGGIEYAVKRREDGKILKPETYFRPNLVGIIRGQAA